MSSHEWRSAHRPAGARRSPRDWEGDTIVVTVPQRLPKRDRHAYADELVAKLVADRARSRPTDAALAERAAVLSRRFLDGRAVASAVTWSSRQRRRWGSCSLADGTIRISDLLKGVPGWVLDTVLLHELAHLIQPAHSAEFHELVNRHPRMADSDVFLAGYASASTEPGATRPDAAHWRR